MTTNETRQSIERRMVRRMIRTAIVAGWTIPKVDDGEDDVKCATERDVMDAVFSVDESCVYFKKDYHDTEGIARTKLGTAIIVLGNDGWDCIADNSTGALFVEEVMDPMDAYSDKLCEQYV